MSFDEFRRSLPRLGAVGTIPSTFQVIVERLEVTGRPRGGIAVRIALDDTAPCLLHGDAKRRLFEVSDRDAAAHSARAIDALRARNGVTQTFEAAGFGWRHASGGTLPLVRAGGEWSLLAFWRDIPPIGWNIANGAASSVRDLSAIDELIWRETAEELLFRDDAGRTGAVIDVERSAELDAALSLWRVNADGSRPTETPKVAFGSGPDALEVVCKGRRRFTDGLFLTFDAQALGLECARILRIDAPDTAVFLDGEISDGRLLDRPVALLDLDAARRGRAVVRRAFRGGRPTTAPAGESFCPVTLDLLRRL